MKRYISVWWGWRYWAFGWGHWMPQFNTCAFRWLRLGPIEIRRWDEMRGDG